MNAIRNSLVTYILIGICFTVYFVESVLPEAGISTLALYYWESPLFYPLQLMSHMFLHGGLSHLLLNMLGLFMFGLAIERVYGSWKFLLFYMLCGLGAAVIYQGVSYFQFQEAVAVLLELGIEHKELIALFDSGRYFVQFPESETATVIYNSPVVGASGAIYGVLTAFAFLFPNHKIMLIFLPVPIAAKFFVPILLGIDLLSGVTGFSIFGSNIAHAAHIGGAITAFLLLLTVMRKRPTTFS